MTRETMTVPEFHAAIKAQGVDKLDIAFKCPICDRVQSPRDLIAAGAGKTFEDVERYIAFSCLGRFTNAGPFMKGGDNSKGCNWTLGGFLQLHKLTVIDEDGQKHPRFMPATPNEAKENANG